MWSIDLVLTEVALLDITCYFVSTYIDVHNYAYAYVRIHNISMFFLSSSFTNLSCPQKHSIVQIIESYHVRKLHNPNKWISVVSRINIKFPAWISYSRVLFICTKKGQKWRKQDNSLHELTTSFSMEISFSVSSYYLFPSSNPCLGACTALELQVMPSS